MDNEFRVITGTAKEVETELNKLNKTHCVIMQGIASTNEQTTIAIDVKQRTTVEEQLEQVKNCSIPDVVKSLPNDDEVKAHIDTLPYYGSCTTEYNEGFEDGVKWLKEQLAKR